MGNKITKIKKITNYNTNKERTKGTVFAILEELKGVSEDEIITALFLKSDNPFIEKMIKDFEWMLLDAVVNPKRFSSNLHQFYREKSKELTNTRNIKNYFIFTQKVYEDISTKKVNRKIETAYYDLVIQLFDYLSGNGKHIIGISHGVTPILITEQFSDLDRLTAECMTHAQNNNLTASVTSGLVLSHLSKNGYSVQSESDIEYLFQTDRVHTNMEYSMVPFIDETNNSIFKRPYITIRLNEVDFGENSQDTDVILEWLRSRKRLLSSKGVYLEGIRNCGIKEIYLEEKLIDGTLFMVYRFNANDKYAYGYFNTASQFFHSIYHDSVSGVTQQKHEDVKNYILEAYALLTTNMPSGEVISSIEGAGSEKRTYTIDRNKLHNMEAFVGAYVRKLPQGASSSDEANELALRYGIELDSDETFVRPFTKIVHKKDL